VVLGRRAWSLGVKSGNLGAPGLLRVCAVLYCAHLANARDVEVGVRPQDLHPRLRLLPRLPGGARCTKHTPNRGSAFCMPNRTIASYCRTSVPVTQATDHAAAIISASRSALGPYP
jgi:hypothetical protein